MCRCGDGGSERGNEIGGMKKGDIVVGRWLAGGYVGGLRIGGQCAGVGGAEGW